MSHEAAAGGGEPADGDGTGLGELLLGQAAELVAIPSVSLQEAEIADFVHRRLEGLAHLRTERVGDNLVARTDLGRSGRVVIAGHLDTVPGDQGAVVEGTRLRGLGAVDMKGGLAIMLWLAAEAGRATSDLSFVFYAGEEVASEHNGLGLLARERPDLVAGDAAIVAEPTGGYLEAGCQGSMHLRLRVGGTRAHTARAWRGVNAVHRLAGVLSLLEGYPERRPVIDGCEYHEALQATGVEGGIAANVVPDRVELRLNHRFAPDRSPAQALAHVGEYLATALGPADTIELTDVADAAAPMLDDAYLARLARLAGRPPRAKLGWTDVARFSALGVPAANFGPGDPEMAHVAGEWVEASELAGVASVLERCLLARARPVGSSLPLA